MEIITPIGRSQRLKATHEGQGYQTGQVARSTTRCKELITCLDLDMLTNSFEVFN